MSDSSTAAETPAPASEPAPAAAAPAPEPVAAPATEVTPAATPEPVAEPAAPSPEPEPAAGGEPLVNQLQHLLRALVRIILGDEKNFLPALRIFGEPLGEDFFRLAVEITVGRVEIADAHGPRDVNIVRT